MNQEISSLRNEYLLKKLDKTHLNQDPIKQFTDWFNEAVECKVKEPTAMTLATVNKNRQPSARIVLLKSFDKNGFTFFTNYNSRKGQELFDMPDAALLFYWAELERQVRIEGQVTKVSREISKKYFDSRPEKSRISAIISPQSKPVPDREYLEREVEKFRQSGKKIEKPDYWGGFLLNPIRIEFWQGRENRLHDRFLYEKNGNSWEINRLAP